MRLVVFSHKPSWRSSSSPTGYATSGGFPLQMRALSEIFDTTTVVVPIQVEALTEGEMAIDGHDLRVLPVSYPWGRPGWPRKAMFPLWLLWNARRMVRACIQADAVHVPIPGDIGMIGIALAHLMSRPLFVRYCGNWLVPSNDTQKFFKRCLEKYAGGRRLLLATGGSDDPPSPRNPAIKWIFATSLTESEIQRIGKLKKLPDAGEDLRLITVGRQEQGKGTDVLIEAVGLLSDTDVRASLDVVGSGSELQRLRDLCRAHGVSEQVRFHGMVDHERVIELLGRAHLFCFPTRSEGFPKAVLEAMAVGLPIVTTRVSVLPHLVKQCGVVLDEATPVAIRDGILTCVGSATVYADMSEAAIRSAPMYSLERWQELIRTEVESSWGVNTRTVS
jgi:glycosyltransferase involved in cell wall biosynthesis